MPAYQRQKVLYLTNDIEFSGGSSTLVNVGKVMTRSEMDTELTELVKEATGDA